MFCRLCLAHLTNSSMKSLCHGINYVETPILNNVMKYLEIEFEYNDEVSNMICKMCWKQLHDFETFCMNIRKKQKEHKNKKVKNYDTVKNAVNDNQLQDTTLNAIFMKAENINTKDLNEIFSNKVGNFESLYEYETEEKGMESNEENMSDFDFKEQNTFRRKKIEKSKSNFKIFENTDRTSAKSDKRVFHFSKIDGNKFLKEHLQLICQLCKEKCDTFTSLKHHFRSQHDCAGFIECCNTRFKKRFLLVDHIKMHIDPHYFKCKICSKVLTSRNSYNNHMYILHPPVEELKFECNVCLKKFSKQYLLDTHVPIHHKKTEQKCEMCNKTFRNQLSLKQHISNIHLNLSHIICDLCGLLLKNKQNLKYHMSAKHNIGNLDDEKQCNLCGNWLKNSRSLQKHMNRHQDEASENNFSCTICGTVKSTRVKLAAHIRYHHSKKIFKCSLCRKQVKSQISLNEHMATHTGQNLYSCPFCSKAFKSNANMYKHKKKSHPDQIISK